MKLLTKLASIIAAVGGLALTALPAGATEVGQAPARSPFHPAASQEVATLLQNHVTYNAPGGRIQGSVNRHRPITGEETTLPVLKTTAVQGATWLLVRLPGRPNSHTGWIHASQTRLWHISWHIYVTIGPATQSFSNERRAYIYDHGQLVRDWLIVPGASYRQTPTGEFFVEESINLGYHAEGGPYSLATSARSNVYKTFNGGPGQVGLHGMADGLRARPGTAVSHGCVRFLNKEIIWLAKRIYPGTPVTIVR